MPPCAKCGHDNPEGARFCSQCGAAVSAPPVERLLDSTTTTQSLAGSDTPDQDRTELTAVDQAAVDALPAGSALLVVQKGPNSGSRFLLDSDITTAGRHPDSDIFLDDVTVSRRHAELHRRADGFLVRDVGSLNGTYVNRERIESATLSGGDEVQIGKYRLVYHASEQAAGEA